MLNSGRAKLLGVTLLVGLLVVLMGPGPDGFFRLFSPEDSGSDEGIGHLKQLVEEEKPGVDTSNTDERFVRFTDGTVHWMPAFVKSRRLHQEASARGDLEIVEQLLGGYRLMYGENPVGVENFEITAALMGDNPKKVFFIDPELLLVNEKEELLDRWGSPYRFHALSGERMNVHSLGPDKILWSEDDEFLFGEE